MTSAGVSLLGKVTGAHDPDVCGKHVCQLNSIGDWPTMP